MPIFSQRYHRALNQGTLVVEIPSKSAAQGLGAVERTQQLYRMLQRDPTDKWLDPTTALDEAESELITEHGWEHIPGAPAGNDQHLPGLRHLVLNGAAAFVFDAVELAYGHMQPEDQEKFKRKINSVFELQDCPWRLCDGEFFKLDADFVGARIAASAHDGLAANRFAGAADEYAKARQELAAGNVKDAILHAGKSFESVMKVMTCVEHGNADQLIKALANQAYFDDLPDSIRIGFSEQVLKTLPFMRNRLAGHGQGAVVIEVPPVYGELAIQLAGAFHNFLLAKHLARQPPPPEKSAAQSARTPALVEATNSEIPF